MLGFKKNVNRATTQVMMKTGMRGDFGTFLYCADELGHVEKTNDRDYEVEERYERPTTGAGLGRV